MTRFFALALTISMALTACAPTTKTGEDLATIVRAERGQSFQGTECEVPANLVGQSHTQLNTMKFKVPIRVIFPGTTVTGESVANRLNFTVDKKGVIKEITCG